MTSPTRRPAPAELCRHRTDGLHVLSLTAIDVGPFIATFVIGVLCGRFVASRTAWVVAFGLPVAHFVLSAATGRAGEDLFSYVVPINIALAFAAGVGVAVGRRWPRGTT